jgi:hypothetical protein
MWDFAHEWTPIAPAKKAYILDADINGSARLRWALAGLGYKAEVTEDLGAALDELRASPEPAVVLFDIEAPGETLGGGDYARLVGALLEDRALARRHLFAAVSHTPDEVEITLGKVLGRLQIPLFAKPCNLDAIVTYVKATTARPAIPGALIPSELATI